MRKKSYFIPPYYPYLAALSFARFTNQSVSVVENRFVLFPFPVFVEGPMAGLRFPVVADSDGQLSRSFGILHLRYVG